MDLAHLPPPTATLKAQLEAMPGAVAEPRTAPRSPHVSYMIYKIMGKMFAILTVRKIQNVIFKCDPVLAETLRGQYAGVGRRSHLDPRFWIAVDLDADVPPDAVARMAEHSYDQVRATLTRKQQADLAALAEGG